MALPRCFCLALWRYGMTSKTGGILCSQIVAMLKKHGYAVNVIVSGDKSTPDILACVNGMFVAIEVKSLDTGDTLKVKQSNTLQSIYDSGGVAMVASSLDDARKAVLYAKAGVQGPPPPALAIKAISL